MFENTYLVTDKMAVFSEQEVDAAEAQLGTTFPGGYREFVTTLGKGCYGGVAAVPSPSCIVADYKGPKQLLREFSTLWEPGETDMEAEQVAQAIVLAQSINGEMEVLSPEAPNVVYVLPRSGDVIQQVGATLMDALEWMCEPEGRSRFRYFNSEIDQEHVPIPLKLNLSYIEFRNWLLVLHRHDHVEEAGQPNEASGSTTLALLSGGRVQIAQPGEIQLFMAFFKCFSGYVMCYTDSFGRLNLQVTHDPTNNDSTAAKIATFLQGKAAPQAVEVNSNDHRN